MHLALLYKLNISIDFNNISLSKLPGGLHTPPLCTLMVSSHIKLELRNMQQREFCLPLMTWPGWYTALDSLREYWLFTASGKLFAGQGHCWEHSLASSRVVVLPTPMWRRVLKRRSAAARLRNLLVIVAITVCVQITEALLSHQIIECVRSSVSKPGSQRGFFSEWEPDNSRLGAVGGACSRAASRAALAGGSGHAPARHLLNRK